MPPKAKFTKEEIVSAALDIIREGEVADVTARALGQKLGSSACPIFTVFSSMDEVMRETVHAAKAVYAQYVQRGLQDVPAFKGVGVQYIRFALTEPKLFQLLFMSEQAQKPNVDNVLPVIDDNYAVILQSVRDSYALNKGEAEKLYRHLWIYTHGIATLCATNTCAFTPEEIGKMLTEVHTAILTKIKGEKE